MMLQDLLDGFRAGTPQMVGNMTMIPLMAPDSEYNDVGLPTDVTLVGDNNYSSLHLGTSSAQITIVPQGLTFITKQNAQDRAMPSAHLVKKGRNMEFPAFCVQSSQGGYIKPTGDHEMRLLPLPVKQQAYKARKRGGYDKLWASLAKFNNRVRVDGDYLVSFFKKYASQLDQFVAEFELVEQQRGAIIVINDDVAGVEIAPNQASFAAMWEPLIRDCYGSVALSSRDDATPDTAQVLGGVSSQGFCKDVRSLDDLVAAVEVLEQAEKDFAKKIVVGVLQEVEQTQDAESLGELTLIDIETESFVGQAVEVKDHDGLIYASLMAKPLSGRQFSWN